jgi:hypothetical protein
MAKLFGRFLLFGEEASLASMRCEPVVEWITMRVVGFVLEVSCYAASSNPFGFNFQNF